MPFLREMGAVLIIIQRETTFISLPLLEMLNIHYGRNKWGVGAEPRKGEKKIKIPIYNTEVRSMFTVGEKQNVWGKVEKEKKGRCASYSLADDLLTMDYLPVRSFSFPLYIKVPRALEKTKGSHEKNPYTDKIVFTPAFAASPAEYEEVQSRAKTVIILLFNFPQFATTLFSNQTALAAMSPQ